MSTKKDIFKNSKISKSYLLNIYIDIVATNW